MNLRIPRYGNDRSLTDMSAKEDDFNLALEVDILAAALSLNRQESGDLLDLFVRKLQPILPHNTQVKRRLLGFGEITSVTICFDECHYQISRENHGKITTKAIKIIGGVRIKTTEIPPAQWSQLIAQSLTSLANHDAQVRNALSQLILG